MNVEPDNRIGLTVGAWYGDAVIDLEVPTRWMVTAHRPRLPAPLSDEDLAAALERPVGQPPIRELARGKQRPVIIVDDLTRPTPAYRVLPFILEHLAQAGVDRRLVTIVVGSGTHGAPGREQILKKVGSAAVGCRLLAHDDRGSLARIGKTSQGTPIILNREVARADLLIGVGGVYPQHSVGFGGGSKLLLGVLGRRSIMHLHYGHSSVAGTYNVDNDFRRDLDEMARAAGLRTIVTLHVNERREVIRIACGDHSAYYRDAVEFSRTAYGVPLPGDADVVIVNAYPMDVSLTFTRSKGMAPLFHSRPGASRVLISACSEGLGYHGLFPFLNGPRYERQLHILRRLQVIGPAALPGRLARRLVRQTRRRAGNPAAAAEQPGEALVSRYPIWLYAPAAFDQLPARIPGMGRLPSWRDVLRAVELEQPGSGPLKAVVYTCAPLQCLDLSNAQPVDHLAGAAALLGP